MKASTSSGDGGGPDGCGTTISSGRSSHLASGTAITAASCTCRPHARTREAVHDMLVPCQQLPPHPLSSYSQLTPAPSQHRTRMPRAAGQGAEEARHPPGRDGFCLPQATPMGDTQQAMNLAQPYHNHNLPYSHASALGAPALAGDRRHVPQVDAGDPLAAKIRLGYTRQARRASWVRSRLRVADGHILQVDAGDPLAAALDDVLGAVGQLHVTEAVDVGHIARAEPAVRAHIVAALMLRAAVGAIALLFP